MNAAAAAGLALVVGLAVGVLLTWLVVRRPEPQTAEDFVDEPVRIPAGVSQLLSVLGTSAVLVGPHDEVLESTSQARTVGIVRGSRIAIGELLDLIRTVRQDRVIRSVDLELRPAGPGTAAIFLSARIAPLNEELVVVLAEDRTTAVRVEETRRDFVANVSHELKTPIGAVALLSEAVESAADDPEAVVRFAARLSIESQRLSNLVGQIIDLSRLQADDPLVAAEPVDIDQVLATAVDRSRIEAEQRDVNLTLAGERGCVVMGSERQLAAAVGNLVENAIIYSDRGARVAVAAHRVTRRIQGSAYGEAVVEITVSDNGIGIAAAELDRIFERFYRVDYARSRANGGTGLGLSIVKHIAAAHGGDCSVWSQLGQGSTFTLRLPDQTPVGPEPIEEPDPAEATELAERPSTSEPLPIRERASTSERLPIRERAEPADGSDRVTAVPHSDPTDQRHREVAEPAQNRTDQPQETVR